MSPSFANRKNKALQSVKKASINSVWYFEVRKPMPKIGQDDAFLGGSRKKLFLINSTFHRDTEIS